MSDQTRFCTGCQCMRSVEGGYLKPTAGSRRWLCKLCAERKSESIYKSRPMTLARTLPPGVKA